METFLGIGFVVLSVAVLIGICGIVGYHIHIHNKKVDISSDTTNIDKLKWLIEWGESLTLFITIRIITYLLQFFNYFINELE